MLHQSCQRQFHVRSAKRSPLLALALRSCCDAARADTLHAAAREAIGDQLAEETGWRLGLAGCESVDTEHSGC